MRSLLTGQVLIDYDAGNDQAVLDAVNAKTVQVDDYHPNKSAWLNDVEGERQIRGMHSNATFAARLGQSALGTFLSLLRGAIAQYQAAGDAISLGTAEVLEGFLNRFNTTIYGLDFRDAEIRANITALYQSIGADPQPVLDLGFTMISQAEELMGRDAIQADIDALRQEDAAEVLQTEYDTKFNQQISQALLDGDRAAVVAGLKAMASSMEAS